MDLPTLPITSKRILIVEENTPSRRSIAQALEIEGFTVQQAYNGKDALRLISQLTPDLIISDIQITNPNDEGFLSAIRKNQLWTTIPFIFLTSGASPEVIQHGRELGMEDYLEKPINPDTLVKVVNARLLRSAELQIALIDQAYLETIDVLAKTVEARDPYTHGHIERVAKYSRGLAMALNWPQENLRFLEFGARLHDIGKIIIPDDILKKPGNLSHEEWELMKQHPTAGAKILKEIKHLSQVISYVLYHHERWNGTGYPEGLSERDIPLEGRLLAIADVYDALTTARPYHPAHPSDEVLRYLSLRAGTHFDPELVPIFVEVMQQQIREQS